MRAAGDAGRENVVTTCDSRAFVGNLNLYGNPGRHGFSIVGGKAGPQSLGQHPSWRDLYGNGAYHDDDARGLGILHFLGNR